MPACTLFPASWASPYKGIPQNAISTNRTEAFLIQTELYLPRPHQPIRTTPSWPIRTVTFGPIKLWGFGVQVCMRTNQSGTRSRNFCLCKSALRPVGSFPFHEDWGPVVVGYTFSFHWRLRAIFFGGRWNTEDGTLKMSQESRAV